MVRPRQVKVFARYPGLQNLINARQLFASCISASANICRSVLAEYLTWVALNAHFREFAHLFSVESAGTHAVPGLTMHPTISRVLNAAGVDVDGFSSRRLNSVMVEKVDLVLAATSMQRDRIISMRPSALRSTFTLKEFARLASHLKTGGASSSENVVENARILTADASMMRGQASWPDADGGDDIADPLHKCRAIQRCVSNTNSAVFSTLELLTQVR